MKQDFLKILNTILLLTISITLLYLTTILKDLSKKGRFQLNDETILDTRTGKFIRIDNMGSNEPIIKE